MGAVKPSWRQMIIRRREARLKRSMHNKKCNEMVGNNSYEGRSV